MQKCPSKMWYLYYISSGRTGNKLLHASNNHIYKQIKHFGWHILCGLSSTWLVWYSIFTFKIVTIYSFTKSSWNSFSQKPVDFCSITQKKTSNNRTLDFSKFFNDHIKMQREQRSRKKRGIFMDEAVSKTSKFSKNRN